MNHINLDRVENYYVLIKINNNMDLDITNNKVQVIGIFSSKKNAEEKINNSSLQLNNNHNPKYIIQGPFTVDNSRSDILNQILTPNLIQHPDIFNPDIFPNRDQHTWKGVWDDRFNHSI